MACSALSSAGRCSATLSSKSSSSYGRPVDEPRRADVLRSSAAARRARRGPRVSGPCRSASACEVEAPGLRRAAGRGRSRRGRRRRSPRRRRRRRSCPTRPTGAGRRPARRRRPRAHGLSRRSLADFEVAGRLAEPVGGVLEVAVLESGDAELGRAQPAGEVVARLDGLVGEARRRQRRRTARPTPSPTHAEPADARRAAADAGDEHERGGGERDDRRRARAGPPSSARARTLNERPSEAAITTRLGARRASRSTARAARATTASADRAAGRAAMASAAAATTTPTHHGARAPMRTMRPVPTASEDGVGDGVPVGLGRAERPRRGRRSARRRRPGGRHPAGSVRPPARPGTDQVGATRRRRLATNSRPAPASDRGAADLEDQRGVGVARVGEVRRRRAGQA